MNILVSSIEKGSGKTMVSAGIAAVMQSLGYKTGIYKPIQTGAADRGKYLISPDLTFVKMVDPYIKTHSTYMFKTKAVPAVCAAFEKADINIENIQNDYEQMSKQTDILLVEAPGGLMTPIKDKLFFYHIVQKLNLPVLFIVSPTVNAINSFFNEVNTAKMTGLCTAGAVINKFPVYSENTEIKTFPQTIEEFCDVKILGLIRNFRGKSISTNILINEILNGIDLQDLLKMKISKLNGV